MITGNSSLAKTKESGQSLAEFALIAPVLVLILLGMLDLGRVFNAQLVLTNAAREGVRYAMDHPTASDLASIQSHVIQEASAGGISPVLVTVPVYGTSESFTPITVTVKYTFTMFTTKLLGVGSIPLQASAVMQVR